MILSIYEESEEERVMKDVEKDIQPLGSGAGYIEPSMLLCKWSPKPSLSKPFNQRTKSNSIGEFCKIKEGIIDIPGSSFDIFTMKPFDVLHTEHKRQSHRVRVWIEDYLSKKLTQSLIKPIQYHDSFRGCDSKIVLYYLPLQFFGLCEKHRMIDLWKIIVQSCIVTHALCLPSTTREEMLEAQECVVKRNDYFRENRTFDFPLMHGLEAHMVLFCSRFKDLHYEEDYIKSTQTFKGISDIIKEQNKDIKKSTKKIIEQEKGMGSTYRIKSPRINHELIPYGVITELFKWIVPIE
ncbi:hypothetical protein ADUPG1_010669 [Aduncisulcus paluster]|uniref:Uncharacterized protein n=1 Tax=Aduncisulcus paluster TaxID=2918883 RepID=A0ABQ5JVY4_9EUKA|nr:hypothetical protein ADUPG1_010669 [Aduncisulcus paluster]